MLANIDFKKQGKVLLLNGVLDRDTLQQLWLEDKQLFDGVVESIDVSGLSRVDSAGLALLTYFCRMHKTYLVNATTQLMTLVKLYNLKFIMS